MKYLFPSHVFSIRSLNSHYDKILGCEKQSSLITQRHIWTNQIMNFINEDIILCWFWVLFVCFYLHKRLLLFLTSYSSNREMVYYRLLLCRDWRRTTIGKISELLANQETIIRPFGSYKTIHRRSFHFPSSESSGKKPK